MKQSLDTAQLFAFFGNSKRRAAALTIGFLLIAAALWQFLVVPQQDVLTKAQEEANTRRGKQDAMEQLIRRKPLTDRTVATLEEQMASLEAEGYLTPLLNSYAMRCKALLDPIIEKTGLSLTQFSDHSQRMLQVPKVGAPEQLQARQLITCIGEGSYLQLLETVEAVEARYPLAVLAGLRLVPTADPQRHAVQMIWEWPTKGKLRSSLLPAKKGSKK